MQREAISLPGLGLRGDSTVLLEPRWWRWFATLVLSALVAVRAWPWLTEPLLPFEDGGLFFAGNYADFELSASVRPYQGYVPFGSNVLAMLLCRLPTAWIPTAFVAGASAILVATASCFLRPAWSSVATFPVRLALALVVACMPLGTYLEFTTLAYAQWPLLLWLFLLLVEPASEGTSGGVARPAGDVEVTGLRRLGFRGVVRAGMVVALALSHPLAAILLPLGLLPQIRRCQGLAWACYLGGLGGYWLVAWSMVHAPVSMSLARCWQDVWSVLAVDVAVESVVGVRVSDLLASANLTLPMALGLALWLGMLALVWRAWRRWNTCTQTFVFACAWLAMASVCAALAVRPDWNSDQVWCVRYVWLARTAFWLVAVLGASAWLPRWPVLLLVAGMCIVLARSNAGFHIHAPHAEQLRAFMVELQEQEQRRGGRRWIRARLIRTDDSGITIRPH